VSAEKPIPRAHALDAAEADILVEELSAAAPGAVPEVKPFALGAASSRQQHQKLTGLERMGEKLARALRTVVEPLVQTRAQVAPLALQVRRFDDWAGELPYFMSLSHYRLRPLQGGMLIAVHPDFVTSLIERFYGGGGASKPGQRRQEFTAGEELLLARLLEKTVGLLAEHWREVTPVDTALVARETSMAHIAFCRPDDAVVLQQFAIQPADGEAHTLTVVYPLAMLRPIEEKMATRIQDDAPSGAEEWRRSLGEALEEVTLPVRSVLARPEISLATLMTLKPGDVIPIQLSPRTPLLVASRPIAEGTIGEQDGRAALLIERVGLH
jgi:flagellar motor switch protein FliM